MRFTLFGHQLSRSCFLLGAYLERIGKIKHGKRLALGLYDSTYMGDVLKLLQNVHGAGFRPAEQLLENHLHLQKGSSFDACTVTESQNDDSEQHHPQQVLHKFVWERIQHSHLRAQTIPLDHLLLERYPNIGPFISRWKLDIFKNC
jgi:hypothetical protein